MNFLAPYMLWGMAAASIPVIVHFFFRSRYRTVPWAAMKFLLTSIEQTSRRVKFQELLLLLLRMAVLLLLALALARPLSSALLGDTGQGEAVDAVFVFDTSFSMGAKEGDSTRFELAKAAALDVLDKLPPYSTVQVISCADRAALLGPRTPGNLDQARGLITGLQMTSLKTDLLPGIKEAQAVLKRAQLLNRELYLFSDMQKLGWEAQPAPLTESLREAGKLAAVYMVRCGTQKPKNLAITAITPQSGIPRPGERIGYAVLVSNTGGDTIADLEVSLMVDGKPEQIEKQSLKELRPGATQAVTLMAKVEEPGLHVITALAKTDDLAEDNRLDQVIRVRHFIRVLVIDGSPDREDAAKSASYYLMHALLPVSEQERARYQIQPTLIYPRQATPELLKDQDLCILANVAAAPKLGRDAQNLSPEFLEELERFVREGHGLMIFAGDNVVPDEYNKVLVQKHKLLPYPLGALVQRDSKKKEQPLHFNRDTAELPAFHKFREDDYYKFLNNVDIWKAFRVEEKAAVRGKESQASAGIIVALRYDNGMPAILANRVDGGQVLFFTTSANPGKSKDSPDPTWNNWPLFPYFPPMIESALNYELHQQNQSHNTAAGTALSWFAPRKDAHKSFVLYSPDGMKNRLGLPTILLDRPLVTLDNMLAAGVYRLVAVKNTEEALDVLNDPLLVEQLKKGTATIGQPFAVAPDLAESSDLTALTDEQIDANLGFPVIHVTAGEDPATLTELDRTNREWTIWLLLAVVGLTLSESVLAWFCDRPIRAR